MEVIAERDRHQLTFATITGNRRIIVLAVVAFDPLSYALAGLLLPAGVTTMFLTAGVLVLLTAALTAAAAAVRRLN